VNQLFKPGSIVIVVGPGGVGKTTVAAALGVAAAMAGQETAVITVDPARRLRDALGLTGAVSRPARLDRRRLRAASLDPGLPLAVIALDVKAVWDGLFQRFVPDAESQRRIFANAFYRNLTERFAGAENYAALELLHELHERRRFALEIVDTPPAMHAFDFIEAPDHLARLLDSKTARWVLQRADAAAKRPGLHLGGRAARLIIEQLERVAGAHPLSAIAEFLAATGGAADAIRQRMGATAALLRSPAVRFVLVTTAAADRLREAGAIARQMKATGLRLGLVVINRLTDESTFDALRTAPDRTAQLLRELAILRATIGTGKRAHAADAAIVAYLEDYLAEQAAALRRVTLFSRALPARTAVAALPEIAGLARELNGIARLAAILAADWGSRGLLDAAAAAAVKAPLRERRPRESNQRLG
jgi:anion-transporting  ArsA/GET3 family ATPase